MSRPPGLFITGTDTHVGKTEVAARIARHLFLRGARVGVYKPAASGCRVENDDIVSDDALALWNAAGRPGSLAEVCPQRFLAPLAPHLAARAAGQSLDSTRLRSGLAPWLERSDVLLVEGAGGLLSPLGDDEAVADLALDIGLPLLIVAPNVLGVINQVLQTLFVAQHYRGGMPVAGIILNHVRPPDAATDPSISLNATEIARRTTVPLLGTLGWQAASFEPDIDWANIVAPIATVRACPDGASEP